MAQASSRKRPAPTGNSPAKVKTVRTTRNHHPSSSNPLQQDPLPSTHLAPIPDEEEVNDTCTQLDVSPTCITRASGRPILISSLQDGDRSTKDDEDDDAYMEDGDLAARSTLEMTAELSMILDDDDEAEAEADVDKYAGMSIHFLMDYY